MEVLKITKKNIRLLYYSVYRVNNFNILNNENGKIIIFNGKDKRHLKKVHRLVRKNSKKQFYLYDRIGEIDKIYNIKVFKNIFYDSFNDYLILYDNNVKVESIYNGSHNNFKDLLSSFYKTIITNDSYILPHQFKHEHIRLKIKEVKKVHVEYTGNAFEEPGLEDVSKVNDYFQSVFTDKIDISMKFYSEFNTENVKIAVL